MTNNFLGPGWHVTQEGLNIITKNNTVTDNNAVLQNALNTDIKQIGLPVLAKELNKSQISELVLQINKIRNISAPKANENSQAAPRMLKIILTDGEAYGQGIEVSLINSLGVDKTPPGTKILVKNAKVNNGFILLNNTNCQLLGGKVPNLYEKWELAKSVQNYSRKNASSDGAPAWVNFGTKINANNSDFKSLDAQKKDPPKENLEFKTLRQEAIAEATTGAIKKFGGGAKPQMIEPNKEFKKREDNFNRNKNKRENKYKERETAEKPQKPSEKVSLFDFLEDKLNITENISKTTDKSELKVLETKIKRTENKVYSKNELNYQNNWNKTDRNKNDYNQRPNKGNYSRNYNDNLNYPENNAKFSKNFPPHKKTNGNENFPTVANAINLTEQFNKMNVNTEFASRSLRQHLNLGNLKKNEQAPRYYNVGEVCLAKYWEDGKYYPALVTASTETTYVVQFRGYGNIEEVLKTDCRQMGGNDVRSLETPRGTMEFRRSHKKFGPS